MYVGAVLLMDTADRNRSSTLGGWLDEALDDATDFRFQTAYYSDAALYSVEPHLKRILDAGGTVRIVLGGNTNAARVTDIETLLDLFAPYRNGAVLTILPGPTSLLVHSKMYQVTKPDRETAWVGSANFTGFGTSVNIEAGVALDSTNAEDAVSVAAVKDSLDQWFDRNHPLKSNILPVTKGLFPQLLAWKVLTRNLTGEERESFSGGADGGRNSASTLVGLPSITAPPRRPRPSQHVARHAQGGPSVIVSPNQGSPHSALPPGVVATVKKLVKQDIRGLQRLVGTWYISLGLPWQRFFPQMVSTPASDPRIDTLVEARFVTLPKDAVASGLSNTSVTLEGAAANTKTHMNARVNLSKYLASEVRAVAAVHSEPLPAVGELVVAEYLVGAPMVVRLTFVRSGDPHFVSLASKIGTGAVSGVGRPPRGYGWLAASDLRLLPTW